MRSFKCVSCGETIEVRYGTNQRGRDMRCPHCGGSMCRNAVTNATQGGGRSLPSSGPGRGRRDCGSGSGRGSGRGRGGCRRAM